MKVYCRHCGSKLERFDGGYTCPYLECDNPTDDKVLASADAIEALEDEIKRYKEVTKHCPPDIKKCIAVNEASFLCVQCWGSYKHRQAKHEEKSNG